MLWRRKKKKKKKERKIQIWKLPPKETEWFKKSERKREIQQKFMYRKSELDKETRSWADKGFKPHWAQRAAGSWSAAEPRT